MLLFHLLLFLATIFLASSAYSTMHLRKNDSENTIQYKQPKLNDVHKREIFENGDMKAGNKVIKNFMVQEQILPVTSSSIVPIYKRTEFMVLSAGIVLYWILIVFVGTILIMCCICTRFRVKINNEEVHKKKVEAKTEE
ncbi:putative integral membrane protein [Acanthocheilonema viteae]